MAKASPVLRDEEEPLGKLGTHRGHSLERAGRGKGSKAGPAWSEAMGRETQQFPGPAGRGLVSLWAEGLRCQEE